MTIFRAIPLSFVVFILFVPLIPVLAIVMVSYLIVALVLAMVIFPFAPPLAILLVVAVYLAWNVVPTMIGTRLALKTKGIEPINTYSELLFPTVAYGLFEALGNIVILILAVIAFVVVSPMTFDAIVSQLLFDWETAVYGFSSSDPDLFNVLFIVVTVMGAAIRAALLVPFASASVGRDPGSRLYTPLVNFGAGFVPLFVITVVAYAGFYYVGEIGRQIAIWLGYGKEVKGALEAIDFAYTSGGLGSLQTADWMVLLFGVSAFLWLFSLQCAGASLVYLQLNEKFLAAAEAEAVAERMDQQEVRALWKDRMPSSRS